MSELIKKNFVFSLDCLLAYAHNVYPRERSNRNNKLEYFNLNLQTSEKVYHTVPYKMELMQAFQKAGLEMSPVKLSGFKVKANYKNNSQQDIEISRKSIVTKINEVPFTYDNEVKSASLARKVSILTTTSDTLIHPLKDSKISVKPETYQLYFVESFPIIRLNISSRKQKCIKCGEVPSEIPTGDYCKCGNCNSVLKFSKLSTNLTVKITFSDEEEEITTFNMQLLEILSSVQHHY